MNLRSTGTFKVLAVFLLVFASVSALGASDNFAIQKIGDGVYAAIADPTNPRGKALSNSAFVITGDGVLVYDSHLTPEAATELIGEIRKVTDKPVRYLVNSHYHGDHTHGNQAFPPSTEIISHHLTRRHLVEQEIPRLAQQKRDLPGRIASETDPARKARLEEQLRQLEHLEIILPTLTFERSVILHRGGREIQIFFFGRGHTDGDVMLYVPDQKIAFAGDLVFHKFIPYVGDGYLAEWQKTLEAVEQLGAGTCVPGHGAVTDAQGVAEFRGFLGDLLATVKPYVDRGESLEETQKQARVPERYKDYGFQGTPFNLWPSAVARAWHELKGDAP